MPIPNVVQYSNSTPIRSSLNNGNFYLGVQNQGYGTTDLTGFWNGITPPSGGYTIYVNKDVSGPSITTLQSDAELVDFMFRTFPNDFGIIYQLPEPSRVPVIFGIASTYNDFIIIEKNYEDIITDDLVLCLDAGFKNSYGGLGNSWRDMSLENNQGTLINLPSYSTDGGGSIVFDGTDDHVLVADSTPLTLQGDPNFTVCGWFKRYGSWANGGTWGIGGDSSTQGINSYSPPNNQNTISIDLWGRTTYLTGEEYSTDEWKHVCWCKTSGEFNKENITIYVNKSAFTGNDLITYRQNLTMPNINSNGIVLGRIGRNTNSYYSSPIISNFFIYDKVLTLSEVTRLYNSQKSRYII